MEAPRDREGEFEEGFREVLAIEVAGSEKGAAYASLLRRLVDRGPGSEGTWRV